MRSKRALSVGVVAAVMFGILVGSTSTQAAVTAAKPSDFNGDGFVDLAIGAPNASTIPYTARVHAGVVSVLYGSATGVSVSKRHTLQQGNGFVPGQPRAWGLFGAAMASGDLNADGYADLAICSPHYASPYEGFLILAFGSPGGLTSGYDIRDGSPAGCDSIVSADFDKDGYFDLATGDSSGIAAAVIYGHANITEGRHQAPFDVVNDKAATRDLAAGDVDGDGYADLLTTSRTGANRRELTRGGPDGLAATTQTLSDVKSGRAVIADFDNDGFADVAVGDPAATRAGKVNAGQVRVWKGSASGLVTSPAPLVVAQDSAGVPDDSEAEDEFGVGLAAGDGNGDGYADLAIGAAEDFTGAVDGGAVTVVPGSSSGLSLAESRQLNQNTAGIPDAIEAEDGFSPRAFKDLDNDGRAELVVSSGGENVGPAPWERHEAGLVFLLPGSTSGVTGAGTRAVSPMDLRIMPTEAWLGSEVE